MQLQPEESQAVASSELTAQTAESLVAGERLDLGLEADLADREQRRRKWEVRARMAWLVYLGAFVLPLFLLMVWPDMSGDWFVGLALVLAGFHFFILPTFIRDWLQSGAHADGVEDLKTYWDDRGL